jgi:hypothetical protein
MEYYLFHGRLYMWLHMEKQKMYGSLFKSFGFEDPALKVNDRKMVYRR